MAGSQHGTNPIVNMFGKPVRDIGMLPPQPGFWSDYTSTDAGTQYSFHSGGSYSVVQLWTFLNIR